MHGDGERKKTKSKKKKTVLTLCCDCKFTNESNYCFQCNYCFCSTTQYYCQNTIKVFLSLVMSMTV